MSITNYNNQHLTDEEYTKIQEALTSMKQICEKYLKNLSPEERKKYGRVNEQNKLLVNKTYDYHKNQPELQAPEVNWEEFEKDYDSRQRLEAIVAVLERLNIGLYNAKIMHDNDNYQAALTDYSFASYKAGTLDPNFEKKYKDLKQFFTKNRDKDSSKEV